jgi:asparagine synthase (glutamine-hydrolysing)
MCGIAGVVRREGAGDLGGPLARMQGAIAHRGPDDRGAWQSSHHHAGFVHSRLSIIDPSPAGHQPLPLCDRFTITYNGEIYNFAELRGALAASGAAFRSNSDTEVLLRLYEAHGPGCVDRLRGMFAFAIWDEQERTCFIARDRFGIKPLYYREAAGSLTFASEVRALLAGGVAADVDATAAYHYFRSGSVPEPMTLIRGVHALEAGHYLIWRDGQLTLRKYWDVCFPDSDRVEDAEAITREALLDSVAHHFVGDVPVGVFLSGGMDSTAIVALATVVRGRGLRTFSLAFPGSSVDEGPEARRTADHFNTDHHEWAVDGAMAAELFDQFLAAADQPSIDGFNTFTVARLARQHDTKVVLSGLGGDELFGGYPSFREVPRLARLGQLARMGGPLSTAAVKVAGGIGGSRLRRLNDLVSSPSDLANAYAVFRGIYSHDEATALTRHYVGGGVPAVQNPSPQFSDPTAEDSISRLELTRYMRNQLLRDADVMSMASGVEVRVPFVDSALFDTVSRLPSEQRLERGKALLRRAVPEIPEPVATRPKRGFALPFEQWLSRDWPEHLTRIEAPPAVKIDSWYRRWSVLAFERWLQRVNPQHV